MDPISPFRDLANITYGVGGLMATTVGGDPSVLLNSPVIIDPDFYRALCYTLEVSGVRDIGLGSVARILWGNDLSGAQGGLTTGEDIIVQEGLNTYCINDMKKVVIEAASPQNMWDAPFRYLRVDPHEFVASRDITLESVVLSPFDTADPSFNITWTADDPDDNATISLFVDSDRNPTNGNQVQIASGISENASTNFNWLATEVPSGDYENTGDYR